MTTPISFAVKPPPAAAYRPSPLGNGNGSGRRAGPPSRRLFEQGDDDEDDDDRPRGSSSSRRPRDERGETRKEEPLVIAALPNRDWRESSRRTPTYRPDARQVTQEDMITHERTGDGPQRSGIRRIVKEEVKIEPGTNEQPAILVKREETIENERSSTARTTTTTLDVKAEPLTEEEKLHREALAALLAGRSENETEDERAQRELRIEMQQNKLNLSEQDAFKRDMKTLPSESTLDDYETIPVSAFGLAMARGMGWDPKGNDNTTVHEPKQRPQLLGLGATPMDSTIKPTHNKSKKDRQADRNAKSGRGFVATSLLVKKEREGSGTPVASRSGSPGGEKRGREEGDGREVKRERTDGDRNGRDRDYDTRRYETEEERAERKAKEREREYETEEQRARRKAREREREYETEEERAKRKARERERARERGGEYETDEQRARRKAREREREQDRERDRRR